MTLFSRDELPALLKALGAKEGVELGVAAGEFTDKLLKGSALRKLTGVDKWNDERHGAAERLKAEARLQKYKERVSLVQGTFHEALSLFREDSLDFVYVDGYAHNGQENGATLLEWWNKLKPGGLMAGHDYHTIWPKTVSAVNRFVALVEAPLYLTSADTYPSWYVWKPGPTVRRGEGLMPGHEGCPVRPEESCVVVGNGPSLKGSKLGARINGFSQVVRCNDFRIRGHMIDVGHKLTLWVSHAYNKLPHDYPAIKPTRVLYRFWDRGNPGLIPEDGLWRVSESFYMGLQDKIRAMSARTPEQKEKLMPSTGLVAVRWLLDQGVKRVHLAGFDHFDRARSKDHHYFRKGNYGVTPEHDGAVEAVLFGELLQAGRVEYLS
jgi:hypothetical protein